MSLIKKDWLILFLAFILTCAIFYGYYFFTKATRLDIVYKNWDGPSYVLAAMSLYQPEIAYQNNFFQSGDIHPDWTWLPAHFPLVPLMIRVLSFVGYFPAMLTVSVTFTFLSYLAFYELLRALKITKHPLLVTLPFIFLSPRWFVVSHLGGTESIFIFFLIMFLLFFHRQKHRTAAVFAALLQATRPQGVFIFGAICLIALWELSQTRDLKKVLAKYWAYSIMPLTVLVVFTFYKLQTGNFWAFFEAIALTSNLQPIPFHTFSYKNSNIETFWQEVNAWDYVIYLAAALSMFRKKLMSFGVIALVYFIPLIFLQHSDISRYAVPLLPFAFIGFSELVERREFTLATLLMSPAIYLYAINFMDHNHGA